MSGSAHHRAYLGAGGRDGDPRASMAAALGLLAASGAVIERVSGLYETEPVGLPGDRPLLNAAVQVGTRMPPPALLQACLSAERALGRRREPRRPDAGARPIDLDMLLYDDLVLDSDELVLPHPRMHLRRFVLVPLAEIAGAARHPVLGADIEALLARCADTAWVRPAAPAEAWWRPERPR